MHRKYSAVTRSVLFGQSFMLKTKNQFYLTYNKHLVMNSKSLKITQSSISILISFSGQIKLFVSCYIVN